MLGICSFDGNEGVGVRSSMTLDELDRYLSSDNSRPGTTIALSDLASSPA